MNGYKEYHMLKDYMLRWSWSIELSGLGYIEEKGEGRHVQLLGGHDLGRLWEVRGG